MVFDSCTLRNPSTETVGHLLFQKEFYVCVVTEQDGEVVMDGLIFSLLVKQVSSMIETLAHL